MARVDAPGEATAPLGATEAVQRPAAETLAGLLRNRIYLGVALGWAVQIMIGYAIAIWTAPVMLRQFGVSPGTVGTLLGLAFIVGGIPGPIIGGFLTDRLAARDGPQHDAEPERHRDVEHRPGRGLADADVVRPACRHDEVDREQGEDEADRAEPPGDAHGVCLHPVEGSGRHRAAPS